MRIVADYPKQFECERSERKMAVVCVVKVEKYVKAVKCESPKGLDGKHSKRTAELYRLEADGEY